MLLFVLFVRSSPTQAQRPRGALIRPTDPLLGSFGILIRLTHATDVRIGRPSTDSQEPAHTAKPNHAPWGFSSFLLSRPSRSPSNQTMPRSSSSPTRLLAGSCFRSARFASPGPGKPGLARGRACHTHRCPDIGKARRPRGRSVGGSPRGPVQVQAQATDNRRPPLFSSSSSAHTVQTPPAARSIDFLGQGAAWGHDGTHPSSEPID